MQNKPRKRAISLLLAFVMVLALVSNSFLVNAFAISNLTVMDAIDKMDKDPKNTKEDIWDLSKSGIIGEVNLIELNKAYPHVTYIDFSDTDTTCIVQAPGKPIINYSATDTFAAGAGTRKITYNGTTLAYDLTKENTITVGNLISCVAVTGTKTPLNTLVDKEFTLELLDSNHASALPVKVKLPLAGVSSVAFSNTELANLNPVVGDTYYARVEFAYAGSTSNPTAKCTVDIPITIGEYELNAVADMYLSPNGFYEAYQLDMIKAEFELLDGSGKRVDMSAPSGSYTVNVEPNNGTASTVPHTSSVVNGVLMVEVDASKVGETEAGEIIVNYTHAAKSKTIDKTLNFKVYDYKGVYGNGQRAVSLHEYQLDDSMDAVDVAAEVAAVNISGTAGSTKIWVGLASSISSSKVDKVGNAPKAYKASTVYLLRIDGASVGHRFKGLVSATSTNKMIDADIISVNYKGIDVVALSISANNTAVADNLGTVTVTLDDMNDKTQFDFTVTIVPYSADAYEIYQVSSKYYSGLTSGLELAELESAINSTALPLGIKKVSRMVKNSSGALELDSNAAANGVVAAELSQGAEAYFIPVAVPGSYKCILSAGVVSYWYDAGHLDTKFNSGAAAFTNTDFTGEQQIASGLDQILKVTAKTTANLGKSVTANAGPEKGDITIPVTITAIDKAPSRYIIGEETMPGSGVYVQYDLSNPASVHIGLSHNFTLLAEYTDGSIGKVPYSSLSSITYSDSTPYPHAFFTDSPGGSAEGIVFTATDRGGYNTTNYTDDIAGQSSDITFTDNDGVTGTIRINLDYPVVTDFTYYIVTEEITAAAELDNEPDSHYIGALGGSFTATPGAPYVKPVRTFDYTSPVIGSASAASSTVIDLPKGAIAELYIVPTFTNEDRNALVDIGNYRDYSLYGLGFDLASQDLSTDPVLSAMSNPLHYADMFGDYSLVTSGFPRLADPLLEMAGAGVYIHYQRGYEPAVGDLVNVDLSTWDWSGLKEYSPFSGVHNLQMANEVDYALGLPKGAEKKAPCYLTYDPVGNVFGGALETSATFRATEHFTSEIDVEEYKDPATNPTEMSGFFGIGIGNSVNANVKAESTFRVKVKYNDADHLDAMAGITATPNFSSGVGFATEAMDAYSPTNGPEIARLTTKGLWYINSLEHLDVLRAYYQSQYGDPYTTWINESNSAGTPADLNYTPTPHADLVAEMNKIGVKVYDTGYTPWKDVTSEFSVDWDSNYAGILSITPDRAGNFSVMFYQEVADSNAATPYKVPIMDLSGSSSDIFWFELAVEQTADGIALAGGEFTYMDTTATPDTYVFDKQLPDRFRLYPIVYNQSALGATTSAALQTTLKGLEYGDVAATNGLDFMYVEDGWNTADFTITPLPTSGGVVDFQADAWKMEPVDPNDPTSPQIYYLSGYVFNQKDTTYQLDLQWTDVLYAGYKPKHTGYDKATSPLFDVAGPTKTLRTFNYKVEPAKKIFDIWLSSTYANRVGALVTVDTSGNPAYVNENLAIQVEYMLDDGTKRALHAPELNNLMGAVQYSPNELQIREAGGNTNYSITGSRSGSGSFIHIVPLDVGTFNFEVRTQNIAKAIVPAAGARIIKFDVIEELPGDQTIYYNDVVVLDCNLGSGLTPDYVLKSDTGGILDTVALKNGILRMAQNQNGTAVVEIWGSDGVHRENFTVTMLSSTGSPVLVPSETVKMDDGEFIRLREKITYDGGAIEYYDIVEINFEATKNFITLVSPDGVVQASGAGINAGDKGVYKVTSASGNSFTFVAEYTGKTHLGFYPEYTFNQAAVTIPWGQTVNETVLSNAGVVDFDDVYLVYGGSASSISITPDLSTRQLKIMGLNPGTVTVDLYNRAGALASKGITRLTVTVVNPMSVTVAASQSTANANAGDNISFTASVAGGTTPYTYQWEEYNGTSWSAIAGAKSSAYSITVIVAMDGYQYRCTATDPNGLRAISNEMTLAIAGAGAGYTVSGQVADSVTGGGIPGAALMLGSYSAVADSNGAYSIANVADGAHALVASAAGYEGKSAPVTVAGANVTQNVALTPLGGDKTYTIDGVVDDGINVVTSAALALYLRDPSTQALTQADTASVDSAGSYSFTGAVDGTYVLVATAAGYYTKTVDPVIVNGSNITQNVTMVPDTSGGALFDIYGKVYGKATNAPLKGAMVEIYGVGSAVADSNGDYRISVPDGGNYNVYASLSGYDTNSYKNVSVSGADVYSIDIPLKESTVLTVSGVVTDASTSSVISGASLILVDGSGATVGTAVSIANGSYSITGISDGNYTLYAAVANYQGNSIPVTVGGANVTNADIALTPVGSVMAYTVSGTVTDGKGGISGATVTLSGVGMTATVTNGNYSFTGVANGTYSMTVSRTGYTSKTVTVTVNGANVVQNVTLTASGGGGGIKGGGGGGGGGGSRKAEISLSETTVKVGESVRASVILKKGNTIVKLSNDDNITWKIDDESIAAILKDKGESITIEGLEVGVTSVVITVKQDGITYEGIVDLTVIKADEESKYTQTEIIPPANNAKFSDVSSSFWGYEAIMYLANKSIASGYENGTFRPNSEITRNEFATMLSKSMEWGSANSAQLENASAHFADWSSIPTWAREFWALAYSNNLMAGSLSEGKYYAEGGRNVSRQEVCVVFAKLMDSKGTKEIAFTDAGQIASWAADSVEKCASNGLISGYMDNSFKPLNSITRAESASIFYKYLSN